MFLLFLKVVVGLVISKLGTRSFPDKKSKSENINTQGKYRPNNNNLIMFILLYVMQI